MDKTHAGRAMRRGACTLLCFAAAPVVFHGTSEGADRAPPAIAYRVSPIIDGAYPAVVCRAMQSAKRSIKIAMFSISAGYSPRNPMTSLMGECIAAVKRGVRVTAVADMCDHADGNVYAINQRTLDYLRLNGVETYVDGPGTKTHDKLVLIDGATLVIGSHNWSKAAMTRNAEISVMIASDPPDPAFDRRFEEIRSSCVPAR